ncbi:hypothetical protein GCM10008967_36810 [Bacillus carboniphilus]|uniref:histidine kinase n=1 Tax=Bacillus carboniphilus TaxID=86663 RepID=A0ABN0WNW2_9BACI
MFRNKEIRFLLYVLIIIASLGSIISGVFLSVTAAAFTFSISVMFIIVTLFFTKWRYKEIEKLSGYLREITAGNYRLDIRDNSEGELSILKNDIYKVTLMLSEQRTQLKNDKTKLTDAISDISHQLKTPLTSMMMMVDFLQNPQLEDEKREEFTRKIHMQLERIDWLVSSLLKLSKIDAGTAIFKNEPIQVSELISKSLEPVLVPMDIKDQTVTIHGDSSTNFNGDFNWTREAIINILKNCVEHTPEGGAITIEFQENALFTGITITDTGKGIPKQELPFIFKRFYKGKNANDDSVGIGLAMAHSIITSQKGSLEVQSKEKEGTQFHIKFYKQII